MDVWRALHEVRVVFGQPGHEEIEPALAALGSHARAPLGPALHELAETEQSHDLAIGCVLEQAHGRPRSIEPAERDLAGQEPLKGSLVQVIVPHERKAPRAHLGYERERALEAGVVSRNASRSSFVASSQLAARGRITPPDRWR